MKRYTNDPGPGARVPLAVLDVTGTDDSLDTILSGLPTRSPLRRELTDFLRDAPGDVDTEREAELVVQADRYLLGVYTPVTDTRTHSRYDLDGALVSQYEHDGVDDDCDDC